jgi:hypothetical protein
MIRVYKTIATDTHAGLMELVLNARTLQDVFSLKEDVKGGPR